MPRTVTDLGGRAGVTRAGVDPFEPGLRVAGGARRSLAMHGIMMHNATQAEEIIVPRGFTVRLDDEQAEELEAVAKVDGVSVAEEIRQAITSQLAERRKDAEFRARLRQSIEDNQRILERLAK
jgi:hypothetical protein